MKRLSSAILAVFLPLTAYSESDTVSGQYYLVNQMETASQMLLSPDHTFQWWMAIGAADYRANGTWRRDGDHVIIETEKTPALTGSPKLIPFNAEQANRILNPMHHWQVTVAVKNIGGVPDLQVIFEDESGHQYQDITNHFGEALVSAPDQAQWRKVGIRHQQDSNDYTWFNLSDLHPVETSIAFWVEDKQWAMKQLFDKMVFINGDDQLTSVKDGMVYIKKTDK
jgi:hypothetical protein